MIVDFDSFLKFSFEEVVLLGKNLGVLQENVMLSGSGMLCKGRFSDPFMSDVSTMLTNSGVERAACFPYVRGPTRAHNLVNT